jgi:hypothetical protein
MTEPIQYHAKGARFFIACFGVFTVLAGVGFATSTFTDGSALQIAFLVGWLVAWAWGWVFLLVLVSLAVEVWPDTGRIRFRSALIAKETQLRDIASVRPWPFAGAPVVVRFNGGFAVLWPVYSAEGVSGLVARIRAANPGARVESV